VVVTTCWSEEIKFPFLKATCGMWAETLEFGTATVRFLARTTEVETAILRFWGGKLAIGLRTMVYPEKAAIIGAKSAIVCSTAV
jgi:hypothetical protein